jgi:hypothetical protein
MDEIIKEVKSTGRRYMRDKEVEIRYVDDTVIIFENEDNL